VNVTPDASHEDAFSVSYREEWTHFLNIVRGRAPTPDLRDQLLLHRVMEAAERSAAEGGEVSL